MYLNLKRIFFENKTLGTLLNRYVIRRTRLGGLDNINIIDCIVN